MLGELAVAIPARGQQACDASSGERTLGKVALVMRAAGLAALPTDDGALDVVIVLGLGLEYSSLRWR